jgi:hypothetical protein
MFVRLALKIVMQNDGEFVDVILLYKLRFEVLTAVSHKIQPSGIRRCVAW